MHNWILKTRLILNSVILLFVFILFTPELFSEQPPGSQRGERGEGSRGGIGTVKGELIDDTTGEPLMYASVVLYRESDSVMVSGSVSDEEGGFMVENVPPGQYYLQLQFVGYPTQKYNGIKITREEPVYDAGTIKISPSAEYLSEVVIESTREMMETGLDRRVINVGQELTAAGGTALELMENIPSVNVDFDGNISLRGSENVTILVDGRPSTLTGLDDDAVLEQLPAEMIDRIEVITNPSVRYDPDGTAGIINIVTKKEERPGYNGMVNISAGNNNRYSGSINFNVRPGKKINFFGNASGRFFNMDGWGKSERVSWFENENGQRHESELNQDMDFDRSMDTYNFQFGVDYNINDKNTITFSTRYSNWARDNFSETYYEFINYPEEQPEFRTADNLMARDGFDYSLNYERDFDEKYRKLNIDLRYSDSDFLREEDNKSFLDYDNQTNFDNRELVDNESINNNYRAEIDYTHPLNENSKFEAGGQFRYRSSDNDMRFYKFDHNENDFIIDPNRTDRFLFDEQRYSAYGIYSTTLGNYNIEGGLRAEQAFIKGEQLEMTDGDVDNEYFSLFPSAHLRRSFENDQEVQLGYSKRINRPRRWALNPFTRYSDPYNLRKGNPNLLPEYIHSIELGYTKYWDYTTLNPSVFYRYTDQMISRYRTMDNEGVTTTSWENIGTSTNYGLELIASQTIADWWRVNGNFSYFHRIVEGRTEENVYDSESYSWTARINNNFRIGNNFSMQLSGNYRSPVVMLQGERKAMYSADMGMRYNILDNNGSITLRVSDIFNTQKFNMYTEGNNFEMTWERKRRSRMIFLGFTYRIHDFTRDRDRPDRDEMDTMDDFDEF